MIPADALLGHIGNLGKTGSGKTYTTKAEIVEPLLDAGRQVAIVDPTSAWWGLRLMPDGKKPSPYPIIILGGPHGDLPLVASSGAACARLVTEQLASVVFDTGMMTVADRTRWFTDFAGELYRSVRQPLTVVIDEVHCFAPQARKLGPQQAMMLHAASELFSGGRSRGLRMIGLSQRPAKWHKDSLTSVDALMLHKLMAPQDRAAAKEWIDGQGDPEKSKQVLGSLASLKKGEYWFWFPDDDILERRQSPRIKTFDSSATPVHGAPRVDVQKIDLGQVKAALAEAAKEAEANDPKHLRARIEQLEDDLAAALAGGVETDTDANGTSAMLAEIERLEATVRDVEAERDELRTQVACLRPGVRGMVQAFEGAREMLQSLADGLALIPEGVVRQPPRSPNVATVDAEARRLAPAAERHTVATRANVAKSAPSRVPSGSAAAKAPTGQAGDLPPRQWKVIESLSRWAGRGMREVTREQCAFIAERGSSSSSYEKDLGSLRTAGLIEYPSGGTLRLTEAGLAMCPPKGRGFTAGELYQAIRNALEPRQVAIVDALLKEGGLTRAELAEASGRGGSSSSFEKDLGKLRTLTIVDYPTKGSVDLTEWIYRVAK